MKNILKKYIEFYNENIKVKHIVCTIISVLVIIIFLTSGIYKYKNIGEEIVYEKASYIYQLKENLMLNFLIIFAGITPYCFLSIMGFYQIYAIANKIAIIYVVGGSILKLILYFVICIIASISYSLCIANGIYYCILSSKKFSYSQRKGFDINDFKISMYKLRKNEEKVKEYEEKKIKKLENAEKLNVKVPYLNFVISYVISIIILVITGIFIR